MAINTNIGAELSFFSSVRQTVSAKKIPFDIFLDNIRSGTWQDIALAIRTIEDKKEREAAKQTAPCVTISGIFEERYDNKLIKHSGYIPVDIDNVENVEALKALLMGDRYVVAAFQSISGRGLCCIFKINPDKHRESFQGLSEYLFNTYRIICDPTSINVSRLRFVSFDPGIYINLSAAKFAQYPKTKEPKRIEKAIYDGSDFQNILQQVTQKRVNICENYHEWLRIGFALAHQFKEEGRSYFHILSQYSAKYDSNIADRQFTACLKHTGSNHTTIATLYYYCKNAGIELYSERTKKIAYSASHGKKGGLNAAQVAENLAKFENITDAEDIIKQVMDGDIELNEDTVIDQLELWMRQSYDLRRNEITRYIENAGKQVQQKDLNTIYIKAKKIFDTKLNYELVDRLINSDFVPTYNPFHDFIQENIHLKPSGCINAVLSAIKNVDPKYVLYFGTKWLVGMMSSIHGEHSPLFLALTGAQRTGKTEWFRRLLPKALMPYYAESKLDREKDDEILMTQKILVIDDEMGGKSKKESKRLKELTSKDVFTLREPYGRNNVDLKRLASLGGSTNDSEILADPTGNGRIIPVCVDSIDKKIYNAVDKTELFMEIYWLWKSGFEWRVLSAEDLAYLRQDESWFEISNLEAELIQKYFIADENGVHVTASEIKVEIEKHTNQRLTLDKIGKELKRLGFIQHHERYNGSTRRIYKVQRLNGAAPAAPNYESLPF